jgi:hypothetical protein
MFERNFALTEALCNAFETHPPYASDLPIARYSVAGTTFDLSQMTDVGAAHGLSKVFACLEPFGVEQMRKNLGGKGSSVDQNELVLSKVISRTMLDWNFHGRCRWIRTKGER